MWCRFWCSTRPLDPGQVGRVQGSGTASENEDINVQIEDVTKVFQNDEGNDIVAVEDLNIDIRRGEFLVFVGPSGCGKTTSLRMVAGLETPTEGRIVIEDEDVPATTPANGASRWCSKTTRCTLT